MLGDRANFTSLHGRWCAFSVVASLAAVAWYGWAGWSADRWPGGSSFPGLVFGTLGGLIILFEFALWPRRSTRLRTIRWWGSAEAWMRAHIWLGILTLPLAILHTGLRWGGGLTTILSICFCVVFASGLCGWCLQNFIPRLLWEQVPRETIFGEIDAVASQYVVDAAQIVDLTCGTIARALGEQDTRRHTSGLQSEVAEPDIAMRVGAPRQVGTVIERTAAGRREFPEVPLADALRQAFARDVRDYLQTGRSPRRVLGSRQQNQTYFEALKPLTAAQAWPAIDAIADLCESRRQLDEQRRWHYWLHAWLWAHLPLSIALVILLVIHVLFALRYG